ncbi:MAG TPA: MFS transporter [Acidobacteriota bacterium]|nr:MFS transporter [Acidobacteriota bacterium]
MNQRPLGEKALIAALFSVLFLASVDNQLLIPLLGTLSDDLQAPLHRLGWVFSVYALAAALSALLLSPFSDALGRKPFLRGGLLGLSLAGLATAQSASLLQLLAARSAAGACGGVLSTVVASLVGDKFAYARRGRVMGFVLSSYFAALIMGIPLGAWMAEAFGWRSVYRGLAAGALAVFALSLWALRTSETKSAQGRAAAWNVYLRLLRQPRLQGALGTSFLVSGATLAFLAFIPGYLGDRFQLGSVQISWVFLVAGLAAAVGSPLSGRLSDRWTKRRVFLLSNTLLALLLLTVTAASRLADLFVILFGVSLLIAFRQAALQTLQTELIDQTRRGAFLALRNAASQLGVSACVFAAGFFYSAWGYRFVLLFACLLTAGASALLHRTVSEPAGSPAPEDLSA